MCYESKFFIASIEEIYRDQVESRTQRATGASVESYRINEFC